MLIIGEGVDGGFGKAVDELKKDAKNDEKEKPEEELQKLEEEVSLSLSGFILLRANIIF
jgi:hypothetical protein